MPAFSDNVGMPLALGLGVLLIGWYWAGNELMRRRAHRLALWSKRVVDPLGGVQRIAWISSQAFRLEIDRPQAPFASVMLTGLIESWDVPMVWAWNRLRGRRDMILLQATLRAQPAWGFEIYRPGSLLAGDARHFAQQEGWPETPLDEFVLAAPSPSQQELARDLLRSLEAHRPRLVRLAVRRQAQHLTLALNVPDPAHLDPTDAYRLTESVARRLIS